MNPTSVDMKDMLEAESGLSLSFSSNLFIGKEPAEPDNCVTLFDTPGGPPLQTYQRGENYYYPSVQVRVRNRSYLDGWALANDIKEALHNRSQEVWNGTLYSAIACAGEPALLDWDERGRARFVLTFDLQRREA